MKTSILVLLILVFNITFGQTKGSIRDSISKEPIPYVNIWVEDENIGTTSDEKGAFNLPVISADKILVFSSIGYQTKRIPIGKMSEIIELTPQVFSLKEFVVAVKKKNAEITVGKFKESDISSWFACGKLPWMAARYFPYSPEYKQTPFLKTVKFRTSSRIADAKFNIRLYAINEKGEPGDYIFDRNIFGTAKKGKHLTEIDLSKYAILFPENGFFVAVEWLIIEENKYEYVYTVEGSRKKHDGIGYEPRFGSIPSDTDKFSWHFVMGKWWNRGIISIPGHKYFEKFSHLAVQLILTE